MLDSLDNITTLVQPSRQDVMSSVTSTTADDDMEHADAETRDISVADLYIMQSSFESRSKLILNHAGYFNERVIYMQCTSIELLGYLSIPKLEYLAS